MAQMVELNRYATEVEAETARGILESNGIPAVVHRGLASVLPGAGSLGIVRLFVPEDRVDEAREVLGEDGSAEEDAGA